MTEADNPHDRIGEIIARAYPTLRRMAALRARGSGVPASSVMQDAIVKVLRMNTPPTSEEQLKAAAWRMMEWVVIDRVRSEAARERRQRSAGRPEQQDQGGALAFELAEAMNEFALRDARRHEAFMLVEVCQVPLAQAASILGVSQRTVQRDLDFAKAWLADRIGSHGGMSLGPDGDHGGRRL